MNRNIKITGILLLIFGLIGVLGWRFWDSSRNYEPTVLIPQNYEGGVLVAFNQVNGKPEELEGRKRLYRIPENGVLETQFSPPQGLREYAEFYFVDSTGKRTPILPDYLTHNSNISDTIPCVLYTEFTRGWSEGLAGEKSVKYEMPVIIYYVGKRVNLKAIMKNAEESLSQLKAKVKQSQR